MSKSPQIIQSSRRGRAHGRASCPLCGGPAAVVETRRAVSGGTLRRRRCDSPRCAHAFLTVEPLSVETVTNEPWGTLSGGRAARTKKAEA